MISPYDIPRGSIRIASSLTFGPYAADLAERLDHPLNACPHVAMARAEHGKLLTSDAHPARKLQTHTFGNVLAAAP